MGWLISEYWPWLVAAALLGALASVAFSLRKVEVHTPPAAGSGVEEPAPAPESAEFGPGSVQPLPDGSTPSPAFTIKADASSMLFHTPESPYYGRTRAEVWFDSEASARAAGFARWDEG